MNIKMMKMSDIMPYDNNPRRNDDAVESVAESIRQFGFKVPIVVDKAGVIVAGHTRYKAAQSLKLHEVPCIIADDLTPQQVKAFRLADNKTAELSTWDYGLLRCELDGIMDIDMELFGFEGVEPEALDLDDDVKDAKQSDTMMCHCPKCGFAFEVKK